MRRRAPEALEGFFDRYFDRIYAFVFRFLGERTAAEDATQEVFLKVLRAVERLDPSRDPWPWLRTISHNVCRDFWRSGAHRMAIRSTSLDENSSLVSTLESPVDLPDDELLGRERDARIQRAIARLTPPLRETLILREYEELSYEAISRMTGASEAALRKRHSRALSDLAAWLQEDSL